MVNKMKGNADRNDSIILWRKHEGVCPQLLHWFDNSSTQQCLNMVLRSLEQLRACAVWLFADRFRFRVESDAVLGRFNCANHTGINADTFLQIREDAPLHGGATGMGEVSVFTSIDVSIVHLARLI